MDTGRIDFISSYCDRWCERCAFTHRCSAFAANAAIGMCGDVGEGLELAFGARDPVELDDTEPDPEEVAELERKEKARDERVDSLPIVGVARACSMLAFRWLRSEYETLRASPDPVIREAVEIVSWDHTLIWVKLHRALDGRDRCRTGEDDEDDPVQNDWNGTAKLTLILLERSEAAWRTLAQAATGDLPGELATVLAQIRAEVEQEFPRARDFIRPGFDDEPQHQP